jgi:hypothetical protein
MQRDDSSFDYDEEVEGLVKEFLRLKLNFLLIHLLTQISRSTFISGDQVDQQLSTLFVLTDHGQCRRVIEHIGEGFGGEEASSNEGGDRWIPERVFLLGQDGDNSCLEVLFAHVLDNVVAVG